MRNILAALLLLWAAHAAANPALHGTWSAPEVNGRPLTVTFNPDGSGSINGAGMRWQTLGQALLIQQNGQVGSYSFEVKGGKLSVAGGDLNGIAVLTRGPLAHTANQKKPAKPSSSPSGGQELVGKWCNAAQFSANAGGGSSRMECFELKPDGTYTYRYEGSMSAYSPGMYGGTASQSSDAGRWSYDGAKLTAHSASGKVASYTLEKKNHPKNKRDPMICLNGTCYVTYYNKPAWQ